MRFATRAFLWSFIPFTALLLGSFWAIQVMVMRTVHSSVHDSLRESQMLLARARERNEVQNGRSLRVMAANPALEAGIQLLSQNPTSAEARLTVEDQLREICSGLGFDFLIVHGAGEKPLAGVLRRDGGALDAIDLAALRAPERGYFEAEGQAYQVASVPVNVGIENLGTLSVGERFDFAEFHTPAVLTRHGVVVVSNIPGIPERQIGAALKHCSPQAECELQLGGETWLSLPVSGIYFGGGYVLRTLQSVDAASAPMQSILREVFIVAGLGAILAALVVGFVSSRSVAEPLADLVTHLRAGEGTGLLPEFPAKLTSVQEIRDLCESFNRAAGAVREGRENLHRAYVQFVESLASALDARDPYTAGHSRRVSEYACAIARSMRYSSADLEEIRIGALLHDIGKIGIADEVLQKPGKLTEEEFAIIQQHPTIGRRILEGVQGFHPYLPVVELHHEDWDGNGYPHGLLAEATPLSARIVHVADAYDAMTSDRPYRRGMGQERAMRILRENSGTQFDPAPVAAFLQLMKMEPSDSDSVARLAQAVSAEAVEKVL
jgi:putative nucleotidyltransferase with HDIG domain